WSTELDHQDGGDKDWNSASHTGPFEGGTLLTGSVPLTPEQRIDHIVDPLAVQIERLPEVPLLPEAESLQKCHRAPVPGVDRRGHPMLREHREEMVDCRPQSLGGIPATLVIYCKRTPNLTLLVPGIDEMDSDVADDISRLFLDNKELIPRLRQVEFLRNPCYKGLDFVEALRYPPLKPV